MPLSAVNRLPQKWRGQHNNCNILAFGARVVGAELANMIVETWLDTDFEGGRHQRRVDLIMDIENKEQ